jgi:hypothetical protein
MICSDFICAVLLAIFDQVSCFYSAACGGNAEKETLRRASRSSAAFKL